MPDFDAEAAGGSSDDDEESSEEDGEEGDSDVECVGSEQQRGGTEVDDLGACAGTMLLLCPQASSPGTPVGSRKPQTPLCMCMHGMVCAETCHRTASKTKICAHMRRGGRARRAGRCALQRPAHLLHAV